MAKNKRFDNVAEGFFSPTSEKKENSIPKISDSKAESETATATAPKPSTDVKRAGRPRAADLNEGEIVFKTSIYLTKETAQKIDIYAIKNEMDRSEAIRRMIRKLDV